MARSPHKLPVFIFHHFEPETFFTVSSTFSQSTKPVVLIMLGSSWYYLFKYQYVRGLISCSTSLYDLITIYNPTTRQCVPLPKMKSMAPSTRYSRHYYFGYDHVMNQYKVLAMTIYWQELTQNFHVFTLGSDFHQWRNIQGNIDEKFIPTGRAGVCIDGTIYYEAFSSKENFNYRKIMLLSFDIRSERFYHVRAPDTWLNDISDPNWTHQNLFNHQGKLGCIGRNENNTNMWIMENVEKQEWSKITFGLLKYPGGDFSTSSGVTPAGEIFVVQYVCYPNNMPLYFDYYNMKEKSFKRVEIEGARLEATKQAGGIRVFAIHDYVENTMWF